MSDAVNADETRPFTHPQPDTTATATTAPDRRGLVDTAGGSTDAGRKTKQQIEARTDEPAARAYDALSPDELNELIAGLEPLAAAVQAAHD